MTREDKRNEKAIIVKKLLDELLPEADDNTKKLASGRIAMVFDGKIGMWMKSEAYICTVCKKMGEYTKDKKYCPNCGAWMENNTSENKEE